MLYIAISKMYERWVCGWNVFGIFLNGVMMMMMISKQGDDDDVDDTESNPITSWSVFMMMMLMTLILTIMKMMTMMIAIERDRDWTQSLTRLQAGQYSSQQTHPTLLYSSPYSQLVVFVYFCICIVITIVYFPNCIHAVSQCVYSHLYSNSPCVRSATGELYSMSPLHVRQRFKLRSVTYWISLLHTITITTSPPASPSPYHHLHHIYHHCNHGYVHLHRHVHWLCLEAPSP